MAVLYDIAFMGTSLTQGTGNNGAGGLPYGSYVPELIKSLIPSKSSHVRIYNFSVAGTVSTDGLNSQLPFVQLMRPKAVVIEFMINDCLGAGSGGVSTSTSTSNHNSIITALKALSPVPAIYLATMNPVAGSSAAATSRSNLTTYNALLSPLTGSGVSLIDCYTAWGAGNTTDIPDGAHPTLAANISKLIPTMATALAAGIT